VTDSNQTTTAIALADNAASLRKLRADFPAFRISREVTGDRTVYVARRRQPGTRPHTLVTPDPHELHAALAGTSPAAISHPSRATLGAGRKDASGEKP
jgi:hypothetical protein